MIPLKMIQNSEEIFSKMFGILNSIWNNSEIRYLFIHSKKIVLIAYYVPGIKLGSGNTAASKTVNNAVKHGTEK